MYIVITLDAFCQFRALPLFLYWCQLDQQISCSPEHYSCTITWKQLFSACGSIPYYRWYYDILSLPYSLMSNGAKSFQPRM